jgi:hypothetical protein
MKRLNLGKIAVLLLLPIYMMASTLKATLDKPLIFKGDSVVFSIEAEGSDVKFPEIDEISTFRVISTSQAQSITSINGKTTQKITKSYTFVPTKSIKIPSYEVEVDGKMLKTSPLTLEVKNPSPADKNAPVQLQMKLSKDSSYIGEPVRLDILFKREPNSEFAKVEIIPPDLKEFWAKKLPDSPPYSKDGFIVQKYSYLLFPQHDGSFTLPAAFAKLGVKVRSKRDRMFNDPFFNDPFFDIFSNSSIRWKKLFSNDLKLNVKPLPDNLDLYGDFKIKAEVDKKSVEANKPINLIIVVEGEGNLDDIKKFSLDIDNSVVYADEPIVKGTINGESYQGVFSQKIAIVADRNFTIPSLSLTFFDKNSHKKRVVKTEPIDIEVKGSQTSSNNTQNYAPKVLQSVESIDKNSSTKEQEDDLNDNNTQEKNSYEKYIYLILGLILGSFLTYLATFKRSKKSSKKELDIIKQIKKTKDEKKLFELLLPYSLKDKRVKKELDKLEKNIYQNANENIDKEAILDYFYDLEDLKSN